MNGFFRLCSCFRSKSETLTQLSNCPTGFLVVIFAIFCAYFPGRGQELNSGDVGRTREIEDLSRSSAWNDRYRAAYLIRSNAISDTAWAIETAINGMRVELASPSSSRMIPGSYATNSQKVLRAYVEALSNLGPSITGSLSAYKDTLSGDLKNWITISLGFVKDESVHQELRGIFSTNADLFTRLMSIEALGTFADTADIPMFLEAYSDTSRVTMTMDHDVPGGDFKEDIFPLVGAALHALGKMGYAVEDDGKNISLKKLED